MELGNHSEFLGILTRVEMMGAFFVHDNEWRLKGHAKKPFWKWLTTWAMCLKKPSDLGYDDRQFILPRLEIQEIRVNSGKNAPPGYLFHMGLKGIQDRIAVRNETIDNRVNKTLSLLENNGNCQSIVWVGLNKEGRDLHKRLDNSILIEGSQTEERKREGILQFLDGKSSVLITKPRICGFGMNFQNCQNIYFLGLGDSFEQYYQCIRRSWRYGQRHPVNVKIILSDLEGEILDNVKRKEEENKQLAKGMVKNMADLEKKELTHSKKTAIKWQVQSENNEEMGWTSYHGDCVPVMHQMDDESVDLSVFSPPFISLYTYTASDQDLGNSETEDVFFDHFRFVVHELLKVTKPGRNACCHVSQVPAMLVRDGYIGMKDFRGKTIELFEGEGWIYHGEVCIDKDPQAQAIRTHSKGLLFVQLKKDAAWLRPALADYVLVFRKPGENQIAIRPDITNEQWIEWARPIWYGIRESNTLSVVEARSEKDERHICPLQLGVIERCIRLWSNPREIILDPFAGIGSTGFEAIRLERKSISIELKKEYFDVMIKNLERAGNMKKQGRLF
jgi:DNA modification methylase